MKKILFCIIAMIAFSFYGTAQTRTSAPTAEHKIHIEFGRKSQNCTGFGICIFRVEIEIEDVIAIIQAIFNRDGKMEVRIPQAFYEANKSKLANNVLTIDEDFAVPSTETSKMGRAGSFTIKKGKYPLVFNPATNTYNCTF